MACPQKGVPVVMLAGFDVDFDVEILPFWLTCNRLDRDFGCHGTVLNDMEHDGTLPWSRDLEIAALFAPPVGKVLQPW